MAGPFETISFGSSGIRGPYGEPVTVELAQALGQAIGRDHQRLAVARDPRTTGPTLEQALIAGATSMGCQVTRLGIAPTPTLAFEARHHDLGVMITASHNPPTDNGFKLWQPDGSAIGPELRTTLLDLLANPPEPVAWDACGQVVDRPEASAGHRQALLETRGPLPGQPRIVLDAGNGAAGPMASQLLSQAGARLTTLNAQPDGTFPGRPSETTAENLTDLSQLVRTTQALCGIAHDGDGDRCVVVDETGRVVSGDALLALIAQELEAEQVVVPVDTSRLVWQALPEATIEITPVGDAYVSEALAQLDPADGTRFGGEPSGAYILPEVSLCPDGPHAGLLAARIAAEHGGLAKLVDELPTFETRRANLAHTARDPDRFMAPLAEAMADWGQTSTLDGIRVDTEDGWVLVRPSGTEPKVRLTTEAASAQGADDLMARARELVAETLEEVGARA